MLTKNEVATLTLSPTKKDFVQIWNELLDVAGKLSERWDPTSTNEGDPGIVLLKVLAALADKLNYNIDKNILEAFMPTAAQEDSMRKLCEMLGYNIKYYQSAVTPVTIKYHNSEPSEEEKAFLYEGVGAYIPKFTTITNSDQNINYFTLEPAIISAFSPSVTVKCMEGQIVHCESLNDNNVISISHISEHNRFYLPETQIAENGIFIYNVVDTGAIGGGLVDGAEWVKVDNLNVLERGSRAFKFGFDSYESRPYIEFPEDYSELFNDGIFIYYTRTSGINGNISPNTLTQIELPSTDEWSKVAADSFSASNTTAATNGADLETIKQAYNNFKKTIGTFETLVTCRDYMNKIYSMLDTTSNKPLVSNIRVTDIRDDINKAAIICSCDDTGIFYKERPLISSESTEVQITSTRPIFTGGSWRIGSATGTTLSDVHFTSSVDSFNFTKSGVVSIKNNYWMITQDMKEFETNLLAKATTEKPAMDSFDLILYPFKSYTPVTNNLVDIDQVYNSSFGYNEAVFEPIDLQLNDLGTRTIAHNLKLPGKGDIVSINNYLRLNATVATNSKITAEEGTSITKNIKMALANTFNMRELDFGEEIPFDSIIEAMESADSRIRVVSLTEPDLYTTYSVIDGYSKTNTPIVNEYAVASDNLTKGPDGVIFNTDEAKKIYNKLVLRNVLAGRVPLFNYAEKFETNFSESPYQATKQLDTKPESLPEPDAASPFTIYAHDGKTYAGIWQGENVSPVYTETYTPEAFQEGIIETDKDKQKLIQIDAELELAVENNAITDLKLGANEFVKFRAPNFTTIKTYPAYVNYHLDLNTENQIAETAAEAMSVFNYLNEDINSWSAKNPDIRWQKVLNYFEGTPYKKTFKLTQTVSKYAQGDLTIEKEPLRLELDGEPVEEIDLSKIFQRSGCVKLSSNNKLVETPDLTGYNAIFEWAPGDGEKAPTSLKPDLGNEFVLEMQNNNPFRTDVNTFTIIKQLVEEKLAELVEDTVNGKARVKLPDSCSWTISYEFEYVPFDSTSYLWWKSCIASINESTESGLVEERGGIFWRLFGNEGQYSRGKYITEDGRKLLAFETNYFGNLNDEPLNNLYVARSLGNDAVKNNIENNTEYTLGENERLYIEYTPSSTAEDGTTQEGASITQIYEAGTIIRPSGFEAPGLVDSDVLGSTALKEVTFMTANSNPITVPVHSLGAQEQIEIRDFSRVVVSNTLFPAKKSGETNSVIYLYKNFNGCPELEELTIDKGTGKRIKNTYTLKDGEAIFYTDQNKTDLAYFTSGTEVTLEGSIVLEQADVVDLITILNDGAQAIQWQCCAFGSRDKVIFQEFQYRTLGPDDIVKKITLHNPEQTASTSSDSQIAVLDHNWKFCDEIEYVTTLEPTKTQNLPTIKCATRKGNGWEACSILELDVSASVAQTLRNTDKVSASIKLSSKSGGGEGVKEAYVFPPKADTTKPTGNTDNEFKEELSFKTNLTCRALGNQANIEKMATAKDTEGFSLKFYTTEDPAIVQTASGKVVPPTVPEGAQQLNWADYIVFSDTNSIINDFNDTWSQVNLDSIKVAHADQTADQALKLSCNILPNTYGIFSIYLDYTREGDNSTWIEFVPGVKKSDIEILNNQQIWVPTDIANAMDKLLLAPGLNCIKIKNSGRLFIKSAESSQGVLLFDNLRLVETETLTYVDSNRDTQTADTLGLNLAQLGYFATSDTLDSLEATVKKQEKENAVNTFYNKLAGYKSEQASIGNNIFQSVYTDNLTLWQDALREEEGIKKDLDNLKNDIIRFTDKLESPAAYKPFAIYKRVKDAKEREDNLIAALLENKNVSELGVQLTELLGRVSVTDSDTKDLIDQVLAVKEQALSNIEKLSANDIILDFEATYCELPTTSNNTLAQDDVYEDLQKVTLAEIDKHFYAQLEEVLATLDRTANSEEREKIIEILNTVKVAKQQGLRTEILAILNRIIERTDRNTIDSTLTQIIEAVSDTDYPKLLSQLILLQQQLKVNDIPELVAQLVQLVSETDSDTELVSLVDQLYLVANATQNTAVGTLIANVQARINGDANPTDADLKAMVKTLVDNINGSINEKLTTLIGHSSDPEDNNTLYGKLKALNVAATSITDLLEKLSDTGHTQISHVMTSIDTLIDDFYDPTNGIYTDYSDLTSTQFSADIDSIHDSIYSTAAATQVWPKYMTSELSTAFDGVVNGLIDFLEDTTDTDTYTLSLNYDSRPILKSCIDFKLLDTLVARLNILKSSKQDYETTSDLIADVSDLVELPAELFELKDSQDSESGLEVSDDYGQVIYTLALQLQSESSVVKRQQLYDHLKAELTRSNQVNIKLLSILDNLIFPNITKAEKYLEGLDDAATDILESFVEYVKGIKANLLAEAGSVMEISNYVNILNEKLTTDKIVISAVEACSTFEELYERFSEYSPISSNRLITSGIESTFSAFRDAGTIVAKIKDLENNDFHDFSSEGLSELSSALSQFCISAKLYSCPLTVYVDELYSAVLLYEQYQESLKDATGEAAITASMAECFKTILIEKQLLADIKKIDIAREFYYNVPIETSLAIEFNESDPKLKSLLNPLINYDINNVNSNFVISKIDLKHLDSSIQLARTSRLN